MNGPAYAARVSASASRDDARCVHDPSVGLWVLARGVDPALRRFAAAVADGAPFSVRSVMRVDDRGEGVSGLLRDAGVSPGPGFAMLLEDISDQVQLYADVSGTDRVEVRLESGAEQRCPKFHVDHVALRLLSTYSGAGTEWCDASDPDDVRRLEAGCVALLKGGLHPAGGENTILHRSPPASAGPRLLLVVDDAAARR